MQTPKHIAVIMDGNGRWASKRGMSREQGHFEGAKAVRKVVEHCCRLGVKHLTLFSFSTENWSREESEVASLMLLFEKYLQQELPTLLKNDVRLRVIGDLARLPKGVTQALSEVLEATSKCTRLELTLAVSYGGREEILDAVKQVAKEVQEEKLNPQDINADYFCSRMWSAGLPDPELLIRSSGEVRISNFLLWQLAYSEIVVSPVLWPDFDEAELERCIREFSGRERRFGLSSAPKALEPGKSYETISR